MIRVFKIMENDVANGEGIVVSLWVSGCSHRCKGCHNPETWNPQGGELRKVPLVLDEIIGAINLNGIQRNFSVLGGEPLDPQNVKGVGEIIRGVREAYPDIKIYLWTGYVLENLTEEQLNAIKDIDVLIDGKFEEGLKDLTLKFRGSSNQRILIKEDINGEIEKRKGKLKTTNTTGIARVKEQGIVEG